MVEPTQLNKLKNKVADIIQFLVLSLQHPTKIHREYGWLVTWHFLFWDCLFSEAMLVSGKGFFVRRNCSMAFNYLILIGGWTKICSSTKIFTPGGSTNMECFKPPSFLKHKTDPSKGSVTSSQGIKRSLWITWSPGSFFATIQCRNIFPFHSSHPKVLPNLVVARVLPNNDFRQSLAKVRFGIVMRTQN